MVYEKLSTKYLQILDQLQVRKVDDEGELPGLMIEEMMESASVVLIAMMMVKSFP